MTTQVLIFDVRGPQYRALLAKRFPAVQFHIGHHLEDVEDVTTDALDRVEKRNRTPGKKPVTSWGFVLRILLNRRRAAEFAPPASHGPSA